MHVKNKNLFFFILVLSLFTNLQEILQVITLNCILKLFMSTQNLLPPNLRQLQFPRLASLSTSLTKVDAANVDGNVIDSTGGKCIEYMLLLSFHLRGKEKCN